MKVIENRDCKIFTDNIEDKAVEQIKTLLSIPAFKDCKVRIMPDVHAGAGCVIGFTADLGDKVIPNIVGVDIGCGMLATQLTECTDFVRLQQSIEHLVPNGFNTWDEMEMPKDYKHIYDNFLNYSIALIRSLRCYNKLNNKERLFYSIGSLGAGNHFIEVDKASDSYYLVVHTGSRNLGKQVAEIYQDLAVKYHTPNVKRQPQEKELVERLKSEGRLTEISTKVAEFRKKWNYENPEIPKDLCYLEGELRDDYIHDMQLCQDWAFMNRKCITDMLISFNRLETSYLDEFTTIHNYISPKDNIIRKGAISCTKGEKVLIPINMRDGALICIGKGNPDWNNSGPHGAGRIMSRSQAFKTLQLADYQTSMEGIYSETVNTDTIDEAPMVYKPIDEIIRNIEPTAEVIEIIKPVFNFKAAEVRKE